MVIASPLRGALQAGGSNCQLLASFDIDFQAVAAAWGGLPLEIREAILALIPPRQARSEPAMQE